MSFIESQYTWNFTSTGTGKYLPLGPCQSVTFGVLPSTNSTATVQLLHRMGSTVDGNPTVLSTVTVPGLGVNDMLYLARPGDSLVSTAIGMVGYTCTAASEAKVAWLNNLASTQSILADTPINFAYIKST